MKAIDHKLVEIALTQVGGSDFERFAHVMLTEVSGVEYVPLGGVHDGGADGFFDNEVRQDQGGKRFVQASTQANHKHKIRQTVDRLKSFGRDPKALTYVTAQSVKHIDLDQEDLTQDTGVFVRIRDANWIVANVNHSLATVAAFDSYLRKYLAFLDNLGGATLIEKTDHVDYRAMCVFLGQEVERRRNSGDLLEPVCDSLILWALEGTDPDEGQLASRQDIVEKIATVLPAARQFIEPVLDDRLAQLSSKGNATGREIRRYVQDDLYCLPYETRRLVAEENITDESLKARVLNRMEERIQTLNDEVSPRIAARVALRAIGSTFEARGLELAAFLEQRIGNYEDLFIADHVDTALEDEKLSGPAAITARSAVLEAVRSALYESSEDERALFSKLARTYSLLFSLKVEPRIVDYFQSMSESLVLLIGTDILVRALSERYLRREDQMTCNLLCLLRDAGADLLLSQPASEEVHSHVVGSDREFEAYFEAAERLVNLEIAKNCPKILIRAYFYAKLAPSEGVEGPRSWREFIQQICDPDSLRFPRGGEQIRKYLVERFGLQYVSTQDLTRFTSKADIARLADELDRARPGKLRILAENDAKMVLSVYGKRRSMGEDKRANPYGYRTWWVTQETTVRTVTRDLVKERGADYMMRPEFLADFLALAPRARDVREAYSSIFPTLLGIRLSNRVREDVLHELMRRVKDVLAVDEARAKVMMSEFSDRLKTRPTNQWL